jgi:hypothetical protein
MAMEISQWMKTAQINTAAGVGKGVCCTAVHCAAVLSARVASGGILAVPCLLTSRLKIGSVLCAMESLCGTCELYVQMLGHILRRLREING